MHKGTLVLSAGGIHPEPGWSRLDWRVAGLAQGPFVLTHAVPEADQALLPEPTRADHAVVTVLLRAMEEGLDIVVKGEVSPTLLDGLETLQEIWHRWRPSKYRLIGIRAESESEVKPSADQRSAVFAFSGGVDASFSLFRHLAGQAGRNTRRPGAALLVHGMDIPLERADYFANAADRAESMLDGTAVRLIRMRTNSRQLKQYWHDSHGLELSGTFVALQRGYAFALIGSTEAYEYLMLPWGSTPLTDHLASTAAMRLIHDGCAFDRTEKVAWLAANTRISDRLRVCWAGEQADRNCGRCEKCVRTMLNFWAIGSEPPPGAFPTRLTPQLVRTVNPKNSVQLNELKSLANHARSRWPEDDRVFKALRSVLRRAAIARAGRDLVYLGRRAVGRV